MGCVMNKHGKPYPVMSCTWRREKSKYHSMKFRLLVLMNEDIKFYSPSPLYLLVPVAKGGELIEAGGVRLDYSSE